jgi:uncharacterized protein HemY
MEDHVTTHFSSHQLSTRMRTLAARALPLLAGVALSACASGAATPDEVGYAPGALGYAAIVTGDFRSAEAQLASSPAPADDPARLLNLAHVYKSTGRQAHAAQLYRQVLAGDDDPMLALKSGEPARAKALAAAGLTRLATEVAARAD